MKNKIIVLLLFAFSISCKPSSTEQQDVKDTDADSSKEEVKLAEKDTGIDKQESGKIPDYYAKFPKKIAKEKNRYVDSNNILHIDLLGANIPLSEGKSTVMEMFPNCEVNYNSASTEFFDVFDVDCEGKQYTAVVSYESNLENENMVAFVYVLNKPFSMQMIEQLFSE